MTGQGRPRGRASREPPSPRTLRKAPTGADRRGELRSGRTCRIPTTVVEALVKGTLPGIIVLLWAATATAVENRHFYLGMAGANARCVDVEVRIGSST
jgi:hypothetical protein